LASASVSFSAFWPLRPTKMVPSSWLSSPIARL
jgi:hypothetical protein